MTGHYLRLRLVSFDVARDILSAICSSSDITISKLDQVRAADAKVGYLRAKAIHALISQAAKLFENDADEILNRKRSLPLLTEIPAKTVLQSLKDLSQEQIYAARPVRQIEAAGFDVISCLLTKFLSAVFDDSDSPKHRSIRSLIPARYVKEHGANWSKATRILNVCEYVASMTDYFAVDTYRTLTGISLPNYQP